MTYVIAEPCIDVIDQSCVAVCPVDCIHFDQGTDRMLFIDPDECIDCGACEPECPVNAIFPEDIAAGGVGCRTPSSTRAGSRTRTPRARPSTNGSRQPELTGPVRQPLRVAVIAPRRSGPRWVAFRRAARVARKTRLAATMASTTKSTCDDQ